MDQLMSRSYPWATLPCQDNRCFPCSTAPANRPNKLSCRTPGVGYKIVCLLCKELGKDSSYQGETGRNAYTRGKEHLQKLASGSKSSPLVNHQEQHHGGQEPSFQMQILRTFKQPLDRQIEEANRIVETSQNPLNLNSRSEWRSTPLPQLGFSQGRVAPGNNLVYSQAPRTRPN